MGIKLEAVSGVGKQAWSEKGSALLWVDAGASAVSVVMGGAEGDRELKGRRLKVTAPIVVSHGDAVAGYAHVLSARTSGGARRLREIEHVEPVVRDRTPSLAAG